MTGPPIDPTGLDTADLSTDRAGFARLPGSSRAETSTAGLDAAIDHGLLGLEHVKYAGTGMPSDRDMAAASVRAAAPHIRRATLLEAADDLGSLTPGLLRAGQWRDGYVHGVTAAEQMLRQWAER
jgi:hypothetical protein